MIEVRSSPIHGRGVFASRPIPAGAPFHTAHLLIFGADQHAALQQTAASHYVFHVRDDPIASPAAVTGLAMSPISFINHARDASCTFAIDEAAMTVTFTAQCEIAAGEELTIDYGDFAEKIGLED